MKSKFVYLEQVITINLTGSRLWQNTHGPFVSICCYVNLLKPTGYVMHQQFNIQQLYALPTLYLCVLYLSEKKQRLVPVTPQTDWFL